MFCLRDYQAGLVDSISDSMREGNRQIVVYSPPRSGKTVCMAEIARRASEKKNHVVFCVHRKEILDQVRETFEKNQVNMDYVQLFTVQTLVRRLDKVAVPELFLVDEAHRIKGASYMKIIEHFDTAYKLFFTGTPCRLDGKGFDDVATDLILGPSVKWLQENGNVAKFDYYSFSLINTDDLKIRMGEYTNSSIDIALSGKTLFGDVVEHYEKLAGGKQAIVYAHSVEAAENIAKEFLAQGHTAASVSAQTPPAVRLQAVKAFREKQLRILVNVNLFTEGIDLPDVDVCIMLRPTASLALYLQFAMRPLNPRDGKRAILIDHVGNVYRHGMPNDDRDWSLKGRDKKEEFPVSECPECFRVFSSKDAVKKDDFRHCPHCDSQLPKKEREIKEVEKVEMTLELLAEGEIPVLRTNAEDCRSIAEIEMYRKYRNYHPQYTYHRALALGLIKSREDLRKIQEALGYKKGWVHYQAKQLNL